VTTPLAIGSDALADCCRRNRVVRLALFGSVLRDDFGPDSDVDVLVQFEPGAIITLLGMARMEAELAQIVGLRVLSRPGAGYCGGAVCCLTARERKVP
jgi:predicted nucleotidyltransferase